MEFKKPKRFLTPSQLQEIKRVNSELYQKLTEVMNMMNNRGRENGLANWVIVGPQAAQALQEALDNIPLSALELFSYAGDEAWDIYARPFPVPEHIQVDLTIENNDDDFIIIDNGDNGIRIPRSELPSQGRFNTGGEVSRDHINEDNNYYGDLPTQNNEQ